MIDESFRDKRYARKERKGKASTRILTQLHLGAPASCRQPPGMAAFAVKFFLVLVCPSQGAADISGVNPLR